MECYTSSLLFNHLKLKGSPLTILSLDKYGILPEICLSVHHTPPQNSVFAIIHFIPTSYGLGTCTCAYNCDCNLYPNPLLCPSTSHSSISNTLPQLLSPLPHDQCKCSPVPFSFTTKESLLTLHLTLPAPTSSFPSISLHYSSCSLHYVFDILFLLPL